MNIEEKEKELQEKGKKKQTNKQTNKPGTAVNIRKVLSSFLRLLKKLEDKKRIYSSLQFSFTTFFTSQNQKMGACKEKGSLALD